MADTTVDGANASHAEQEKPLVNGDTAHEDEKVKAQEDPKKGDNQKQKDGKGDSKKDEKPPGGYDSTAVPRRPPGYTVKITFHRATNLPMADYASLSSDPYVLATLDTGLPTRHKEDPPLQHRTPTIRRNTDPEWNDEWVVANVPRDGFRLKCRVMDEDPQDHDDRLGNAHVVVSGPIGEGWQGIKDGQYKIMKRSGSKRAYLIRLFAACIRKSKHLNGHLFLSVECLGRTETENGGRAYTVGPMWFTKHYSPMLGRIANRKEPGEDKRGNDDKSKPEKYK
jgi:hypothetical protein